MTTHAPATTAGLAGVRDSIVDASHSEDFDYTDLANEVRASFKSGKTKSLEWRKDQLRAMIFSHASLGNNADRSTHVCYLACCCDSRFRSVSTLQNVGYRTR